MSLVREVNLDRQLSRETQAKLQRFARMSKVDWKLIWDVAKDAAIDALGVEIWEWLDEDPNRVVFEIEVDTKIWFIPIKIDWDVKAKHAEPLIKFIFGDRP